MTPTLPRPIEPGEIRVGMRVRLSEAFFDDVRTHEFVVRATETVRGEDFIRSGGWSFAASDGTWTLLAEAPTPAPAVTPMRMFVLVRDTDVSGVSGTGVVAEGLQFSDGSCAMRWLTETASTAVYASIADIETIHGHGGATRVAWAIHAHGTGCSPWLWDKETDTAWVAAGVQESSTTHVQVRGDKYVLGGALVDGMQEDAKVRARLVPWSERGQANG